MIATFSPVAFRVFDFPIYWYSIAYILGISIAWKLTIYFSNLSKQSFTSNLDDFINYAIVGIIVGGRVGHVLFYDFYYYFNNCCEIIKIWKGGMSFFGGFIGVVVASYVFCKKRKIDFLNFMDLWAISVPIGLFLGRIANFINAELLGKKSDVFCAVIFYDGIKRHPSQIYEAILEGALLFFVMLFSFYKKAYKKNGLLCGIFCFGYGTARFVGEFFREQDSLFSHQLLLHTSLNLNQYMSICIAILGAFLIFRKSS